MGQLIAVLTTPLITRLYSPYDFGSLGLFSSIITITIVFVTLKYEYAIPVADSNDKAANLFLLCIILTLVISIICAVVFSLYGEYIFRLFNVQEISPYAGLLIIGIFGSGLYQILNFWQIRKQDYITISKVKINQNIFGSFSKIIFGLLSFSTYGLLVGFLISNISGTGIYLRSLWKKDRFDFFSVSLIRVKGVMVEFKKFPLYTAPATLFLAISEQLPIFMLSSIYNLSVSGNYTLAYTVLSLPYALIAASMTQVFYGEAAKYAYSNPVHLKSQYIDITKKLISISLIMIIIPSSIAPLLFPIIFGNAWIQAGYYCLPLALVACSQFVILPTSRLSVYGYNNWDFAFNLSRLSVIFLGFLAAKKFNCNPFTALTIFSALSLILYFVLFLLNIRAFDRLIKRYQENNEIDEK